MIHIASTGTATCDGAAPPQYKADLALASNSKLHPMTFTENLTRKLQLSFQAASSLLTTSLPNP